MTNKRTTRSNIVKAGLPSGKKADKRKPEGVRALKKRADIIKAALDVLVSEGAVVSLDRIAVVAGVSKVTIYNHFKTKDDLLLEVVSTELSEALARTEHMIQHSLSNVVDLQDALQDLCQAWVDGLRSPRLMKLRVVVIGQIRTLPELGKVWIEVGPDRLHEHIASKLSELSERFNLVIPDTKLAALQLAGLVVSPHIMYGPLGGGPDDTLTKRLIVNGVEMFLSRYSIHH